MKPKVKTTPLLYTSLVIIAVSYILVAPVMGFLFMGNQNAPFFAKLLFNIITFPSQFLVPVSEEIISLVSQVNGILSDVLLGIAVILSFVLPPIFLFFSSFFILYLFSYLYINFVKK